MHNLVNSLCFIYLFVLNESMSLVCLQCLDVLVCVSMNHFYIVNLVTWGLRASKRE